METEQSVEETVGELPLSWPLKVQEDEIADEEKVQEDEIADEENGSEEIAAAEVDKVAEVYKGLRRQG